MYTASTPLGPKGFTHLAVAFCLMFYLYISKFYIYRHFWNCHLSPLLTSFYGWVTTILHCVSSTLPHILHVGFCKYWLSPWSVFISWWVCHMPSTCLSKSLLLSPYFAAQESCLHSHQQTLHGFCVLWGLASGTCSREGREVEEGGAGLGYLFPQFSLLGLQTRRAPQPNALLGGGPLHRTPFSLH